ncbi:hypothetical protein P4O66_016835 [Electrophorus voltai]|uniref:Neural proliferation, differentiation and control, 1a n=1 Tax=Electrophorus voltai TaxID=2609070 RepID=A0AAD9DNN2_9TELE|nr:hypothetical protein P4O66_016835 [Electrophorus voltai]
MLRPGRVERSPRAVLSPGVLFCIILAAVSASVPVLVDNCPDYIDCAKKGRHFCKQGSSHCGPCLASLEEDDEGHCVSPKRRPHHSFRVGGAFSRSCMLTPVFAIKEQKVADAALLDCARRSEGFGREKVVHEDHLSDERGSSPSCCKETSLTDLDQEIDYLSSIIAKQQVSDVNQPAMSQPVSASWSSPQSQSDGGKNPSRPKNMSHSATAMPASNGPSTVSQHTSSPTEPGTDHPGRSKHIAMSFPRDSLLILITSVCIIMGTVAIILAIVCWVRLQKEAHLAEKVDYPAFPGAVASSRNISPGDKNLAHSAQMYHYQHQKQQMLSLEKNKSETKLSESGVSDEENEEGDFTVYECPGLAPATYKDPRCEEAIWVLWKSNPQQVLPDPPPQPPFAGAPQALLPLSSGLVELRLVHFPLSLSVLCMTIPFQVHGPAQSLEWRGGGKVTESKGSDLLFDTEKRLMAGHRNSGSRSCGVPPGLGAQ